MTDLATPAEEVAALRPQPKGFGVIKAAFRERRTLAMLLLGFSAGLPFAMLFGTLNAWLSEVDVSVATIGILSWVGLFGAFKFLWSPAVGLRLPLVARMGRRRSWLVVCQSVLALVFIVIAASHPTGGAIGVLAMAAAVGAFASATQDIVIDTWRIEAADDALPVDLLSSVYQLGFRTAALVGGAGALVLADTAGWPATFVAAAVLMGLGLAGSLIAPEPAVVADQAVARDLFEHVVKKPDARVQLGLAGAVEVHTHADARLGGVAADLGDAVGQGIRGRGSDECGGSHKEA